MADMRMCARDLLSWYQKNKRDLPWRQSKDPYCIWISEIMLQQTTVAAVIPYYARWIRKFPTIAEVARSREQTILKMWQGLGYYNRVKNIHRATKIIVNQYQGALPSTKEDLAKLPGFGPYTVGAVGSIAFNLPLTIVDANVRRVMMRQMALPGEGNSTRDQGISVALKAVLPPGRAGDFNQALMELGALICRPIAPFCETCPVSSSCKAFKTGQTEKIPEKKRKNLIRQEWLILTIRCQNHYLIQKRPDKGLWAGLWEFPGKEVAPALARIRQGAQNVKEIIGFEPSILKLLPEISFAYTKYVIKAHVFLCEFERLKMLNSSKQKWLSLKQLTRFPLSSGSAKVFNILRKLDKKS